MNLFTKVNFLQNLDNYELLNISQKYINVINKTYIDKRESKKLDLKDLVLSDVFELSLVDSANRNLIKNKSMLR